MSSDRDAALSYATEKTPSILFEVQQGLIDRGAEIGWISQYPRGSRLTCWLIVPVGKPHRLQGFVSRILASFHHTRHEKETLFPPLSGLDVICNDDGTPCTSAYTSHPDVVVLQLCPTLGGSRIPYTTRQDSAGRAKNLQGLGPC